MQCKLCKCWICKPLAVVGPCRRRPGALLFLFFFACSADACDRSFFCDDACDRSEHVVVGLGTAGVTTATPPDCCAEKCLKKHASSDTTKLQAQCRIGRHLIARLKRRLTSCSKSALSVLHGLHGPKDVIHFHFLSLLYQHSFFLLLIQIFMIYKTQLVCILQDRNTNNQRVTYFSSCRQAKFVFKRVFWYISNKDSALDNTMS